MENDKKREIFINFVSVLNSIIIMVAAFGCAYVLIAGNGIYFTVSAIVELIAIAFSVMYYIKGYKKDAAKYYKLFMLFYAFTYLAEILASVLEYNEIGIESPSFTVIVSMVLYGNTLLLAVAKDLGKKTTYALASVNAFFYLLPVIGVLIPGIITFGSESVRISAIFMYCTWFILALNALLMAFAKYDDKLTRGTK